MPPSQTSPLWTGVIAAGAPQPLSLLVGFLRALQEWMGHKDLATTQIYADYAPSKLEADLVAAAFTRGSNRGSNLSESKLT